MTHYRCTASPGSPVEAYVRLLVEPPVSAEWPLFTQTLSVVANEWQPFGKLSLTDEKSGTWDMHFDSAGHAYHVLKNGLCVTVASRWGTFFARLIRDGRAEYIWGPHSLLNWSPMLPGKHYSPDARYSYKRSHPLPTHDLPPKRE